MKGLAKLVLIGFALYVYMKYKQQSAPAPAQWGSTVMNGQTTVTPWNEPAGVNAYPSAAAPQKPSDIYAAQQSNNYSVSDPTPAPAFGPAENGGTTLQYATP